MKRLLPTSTAGSLPKPSWLAEPEKLWSPGSCRARNWFKANTDWKKTLGSEWRQYEETFPKLQKSSVDLISLECHNSHVPIDLIELIRGKKVMVGAIDVATNAIETPEEVANTLRKALQFVDADKLYPCTNCGMTPLSRQVAKNKLKALSAGAEVVRKELSA